MAPVRYNVLVEDAERSGRPGIKILAKVRATKRDYLYVIYLNAKRDYHVLNA